MRRTIQNIQYISEGSYGIIYKYPDGTKVYKVHEFTSPEDTCSSYEKESTIQKEIYDKCNDILTSKLHTSIVMPIQFHYSTRTGSSKNKISLNIKEDRGGADSCFFEMEYIPPFNPPVGKQGSRAGSDAQLTSILAPEHIESFIKSWQIPPYIYTATDVDKKGHFTLYNMKGVEKEEIPWNDSSSYYIIKSTLVNAFMKNSTLAFFCIIVNGYMPRDVEFVYNLKSYAARYIFMSILDFNQVDTIKGRQDNRRNKSIEYDLELDIAHVYIDMIGIRRSGSSNPVFEDIPTQGWFFMISPQLTPLVFFNICKNLYNNINFLKRNIKDKSINVNIGKFAKYVLEYVSESLPLPKKIFWEPDQNFLYELEDEVGSAEEIAEIQLLNISCSNFDRLLQTRIINSGLEIYDPTFNLEKYESDKTYKSLLEYIKLKYTERTAKLQKVVEDNDWGNFGNFPQGGNSFSEENKSLSGGRRILKKKITRKLPIKKRKNRKTVKL